MKFLQQEGAQSCSKTGSCTKRKNRVKMDFSNTAMDAQKRRVLIFASEAKTAWTNYTSPRWVQEGPRRVQGGSKESPRKIRGGSEREDERLEGP